MTLNKYIRSSHTDRVVLGLIERALARPFEKSAGEEDGTLFEAPVHHARDPKVIKYQGLNVRLCAYSCLSRTDSCPQDPPRGARYNLNDG